MKTLKLRTTAAILFAFLAMVTINAQPPQGGGQGRGGMREMNEDVVKERVERLSESLELSEKQEAEILKYELGDFNKRKAKMEEIRESGQQPDREAMRAMMEEMRTKKDAKYKEILNVEQYAKWKEMQANRQKARGEKSSGQSTGRGRGRN